MQQHVSYLQLLETPVVLAIPQLLPHEHRGKEGFFLWLSRFRLSVRELVHYALSGEQYELESEN